MRKCPKCGTELPDEALFCNECGEKLPSPVAEEKKEETPDNKTASESDEKAPETTDAADEKTQEATVTATEKASDAAAEKTPEATGADAEKAPEAADTASGMASYTAPIDNSVLAKAQTESKNTNIGMLAIAAGVLVGLILLIVLISSLLGGGYKAPLNKLRNNFNKQSTSVESYLSCFAPGYAVTLYKDVYGIFKGADKDAVKDFDELVADAFEDFYEEAADEFGDDFKLTLEFKSADHLKDRDIKEIEEFYEDLFDSIEDEFDYEDEDIYEDFADDLDDYFDISLSKSQVRKLQSAVESFMHKFEKFDIKDAYEVKVRFVIEGEDGSYKETVKFYIIKVNGDWFIEPNSFLSAIGAGSLSSNMNSLLWSLYY